MRIAVIGFGAIGSFVIEHLNAEPAIEVSAVFSLPRPEACSVPVVDNIEALKALYRRPPTIPLTIGQSTFRSA